MTGMTIGARYSGIRMNAYSPFFARLTTIVFVALKARFTSLGRRHSLEAANQAGFLAPGANVLASRSMARLARRAFDECSFDDV